MRLWDTAGPADSENPDGYANNDFMMMLKLTVYNGDDVAMVMIKMQAQKSLTDSEALLTRTPTFSSFATTLLNLHLPAM